MHEQRRDDPGAGTVTRYRTYGSYAAQRAQREAYARRYEREQASRAYKAAQRKRDAKPGDGMIGIGLFLTLGPLIGAMIPDLAGKTTPLAVVMAEGGWWMLGFGLPILALGILAKIGEHKTVGGRSKAKPRSTSGRPVPPTRYESEAEREAFQRAFEREQNRTKAELDAMMLSKANVPPTKAAAAPARTAKPETSDGYDWGKKLHAETHYERFIRTGDPSELALIEARDET
jgi:hypothetical protein